MSKLLQPSRQDHRHCRATDSQPCWTAEDSRWWLPGGILLCLGLAVLMLTSPAIGQDRHQANSLRIEQAGLVPLREARISAAQAGPLESMPEVEGNPVQAGTLLAQIRDVAPQAELAQARIELQTAREVAASDADLRIAQKELELALADLRRNQESNEQLPNSVTEARLERLQLVVERERHRVEKAEQELRISRFAVEAAENRVKLAEERLRQHQVTAPFAGVVSEWLRRPGEWVEVGEPVVRVLDVGTLRVEALLDAAAMTFPLEGSIGTLEVNVPGLGQRSFPVRVTFVSPEANPVSGQVRLMAEVENPDRLLRPGYFGTLVLTGESSPTAPGSAVHQ